MKKSFIAWLSVVSALAVAALAVCGVLIYKQTKATKTYEETLATVQQQLDAAQKESEALRAQIADDAKQNDELKKQSETLEEQAKALEKRVQELEAQLSAAKAAKEKAEREKASLQQQIALTGGKVTAKTTAKPADGSKVCYLTFDDGPSEVTLQILDTLKKYDVKATFFVVGSSKVQYISKIHEAGHAVALHCNNHTYSKVYASEAAYLADLKKISDTVKKQTGVESKLVRFPGGSSNTVSRTYTKGLMTRLTKLLPEMGYGYFDWNVSSGDAVGTVQSAATIAKNVINGAKGKQQVCVLMHDAGDKRTTAQALPAIIEGLKAQGFTFAALTPESNGFHHGVAN